MSGRSLTPTEALTRSTPRAAWMRELGLGAARKTVRYGYRVASLSLMADPRIESEIIGTAKIAPLAGAASWVVGMVNVRGLPLPVFDLANAAGVPSSDGSQSTHVLMLGKGETALGLLIDGLPSALNADRSAPMPDAIPAVLVPHVRGTFAEAGQVWLDFDHESFFAARAAASSGQRAGIPAF